jgi:hypothetical protein
LVEHQEKHQQSVRTKDIGTWIRNQHPNLKWIHALKLDKVLRDIENARSSIVISLPVTIVLPESWTNVLVHRNPSATLTVISEKPIPEIQADSWQEAGCSFPFVVIDEHILWLGFQLGRGKGLQPPFIAAKLNSEKVCDYLIGQLVTDNSN